MLPFLKARRVASVIVSKRKSDGNLEPLHEEGEETPELTNTAEDLISAIMSKDASKVAAAIRAAIASLTKDAHATDQE